MSLDPLTEFWMQIIGDSRRTVICNPDAESRIKSWIEARGLAGIITVQPTHSCPPDKIYIVDDPAMDAALRGMPWRLP